MNSATQTKSPLERTNAVITTLPAPANAATPGLAETSNHVPQFFSVFANLNQFKDAQRMAAMLARSSLVPENYRGDDHVADCVIALEIANRIGASVLAVMQNLLIIEGRLGWSSQFLISCLNATKRFSPLRYQMTGRPGKDNRGAIAWALDKSGKVLKSPEITIKMAKEEGWYDRLGSKWKSMPDLMLCYRSATFFTRLYAPEITMGIQTTEELADIEIKPNGKVSRPVFTVKNSKTVSRVKSNGQYEHKYLTTLPLAANSQPNQVIKKNGGQIARTVTKSAIKNYSYLKGLKGLIQLSPHPETKLIAFLHQGLQLDPSIKTLDHLAEKDPDSLVWAHDHWTTIERELAKKKEVSL